MPIKTLIINSLNDKNQLLIQAFKELEQKKFTFALWSSQDEMIEQFNNNRWPAKKIYLGPDLTKKLNLLFYLALLLFLQLKFLFVLAVLKFKQRLDLIVCLNFNEKLVFTGIAKLLRIKIVWLESPDLNYRRVNKILFWLYKINHRFARLAVFNSYTKLQLVNFGFKETKISLLTLGAKLSQYQENIFNKLAALSQANFHRKYFTVGIIAQLNQRQKIETIFQAVKNCLPVIPNLQLIVIGEGRERKNLVWLSKKMKIENLVWLVGEQGQLKKWLDSFDIFLCLSDSPKLDDYGNILEAMGAGLPVLVQRNIGLEDLVIENKTGCLVDFDNTEMLSRQIIKLHQDKRLRLHLGKSGHERVNQLFTLNQMVLAMERVLKNQYEDKNK